MDLAGKYWKGLESIIVSHVYDEAGTFVSLFVSDSKSVEEYIGTIFPQRKLSGLRTDVLEQYAADAYSSAKDRAAAIISDMVFTCNTRLLYEAYHQEAETYMMQYDVGHDLGADVHGSDVMALFWNSRSDIVPFLKIALPDRLKKYAGQLGHILGIVAPRYQSYFASHAIHGDPNTGKQKDTPQWNLAKHDSKNIYRVMEVTGNNSNIFHPEFTDVINTNEACDFWKETARKITESFPGALDSFKTEEAQAMLHAKLK